MSKPCKADRSQTESEIAGQPAIWRDWARSLPALTEEIRDWIAECDPPEIWLSGAGTSAFIGDVLHRTVSRSGRPARCVPTTDLVSSPDAFFGTCRNPLVVSFGRSGNSSETLGTLALLDQYAPEAMRLNITCNREGALARRKPEHADRQREILLPDACHDKGFAMTSSFTTMLLTALTCLPEARPRDIVGRIEALADSADAFFDSGWTAKLPDRAVFLGSGPHLGTAREAALKVLELTAGRVVTCWDSTLGFRHGPIAVVDDRTTVFVFLSDGQPARRYDEDVVSEIRIHYPDTAVISIGASHPGGPLPDLVMEGVGDDAWNSALFVLPAQVAAANWSKALGLKVDNPFTNGKLTRVVSHVQLYT